MRKITWALASIVLTGYRFALAGDEADPDSYRKKENLVQQSARTLFPFSSVTLRDTWTLSRWNQDDAENVTDLRVLTPLTLWKQLTLFRITVPYRTHADAGVGLGNVRIFDLVTFRTSWGLWGIGPVVNVRAATPVISDTLQAGVVGGLVFSNEGWGLGFLNQNLFSDQASLSTFQPILSYQFNKTWSLGLGELPFIYDWRSRKVLFAPIGLQVGAVFNFFTQPVRVFLNPQYNTENISGVSRWTLTWGISFLSFPGSSH